ncbi:MAG: glycosyltransferase family 2 protein [Acidobacteriota bacterium]|nr:glycosyltransferase family 2 protein [Acidobacteriota bacterium]
MTHGTGANDVAIVIVTYNSALEIEACLTAAVRTGAAIWVVDNYSQDDSVQRVRAFPVQIIANTENRGFAAAVNQGVQASAAPFILLLNPDAVLETGIAALRSQCNLPGVAAAAGILIGADGAPQRGFTVRRLPTPLMLIFENVLLNRVWPRNPVNWRFRCFDFDLTVTAPCAVEQPAGAFFMFRREDWDKLGGFDEQFRPLWFEDVDFCARLRGAGKEIRLVPDAVAKHTGAHSILNMALEMRQIYWYGNLLRYSSKHYPALDRKLVCCSVVIGSVLRFCGGVFRGAGSAKQWRTHRCVVSLAIRCFQGLPGWDAVLKAPERR